MFITPVRAVELQYDWSNFQSAYGNGRLCLSEIDRALAEPDSLSRYESLESTLRFACDQDGIFTDAAPAFVALLLNQIVTAPSWAIFAILGILARATWPDGPPGHWPAPSTIIDHGGMHTISERLQFQNDQRRLAMRVRRLIHEAIPEVLSIEKNLSDPVHAHLWALMAWSAEPAPSLSPHFGLRTLRANTRASRWGFALFLPKEALTSGDRLLHAAVRCEEEDLDAVTSAVLKERLRASDIDGLQDFPWYGGSLSAAAVELVARSARSRERKHRFMREILAASPAGDVDGFSPPTGVTLATWYFLQGLMRVFATPPPELLGPEEINDKLSEGLRLVNLRRSLWDIFGNRWLPHFGIMDPEYLQSLIDFDMPVLGWVITDYWGYILRRQSVWKWLHQIEKDTPPLSSARKSAADLCGAILKRHLTPDSLRDVAAYCLTRPRLLDVAKALEDILLT